MKKVYMIHENTKPILIKGKYVQLVTDFVVTSGWIKTEDEKDPNCDEAFESIYTDNTKFAGELHQYLPGVFFDTYEEGCKVLVKILRYRTNNDLTIRKTYNDLVEKYPEAAI